MRFADVVRGPRLWTALGAAAIIAVACDNPAAPIPGAGDPENISLVTLTLTPVGGGTALTAFVRDSDGTALANKAPNPQSPAILTLTKGVTYNGTIVLKNDIDPNNVIDISAEVFEERNFHRFFYTVTTDTLAARDSINLPPSNAAVKITVPLASQSLDSLGAVFGHTFQVVVDAAAPSGSSLINIQLHHFEGTKGNGLGTTFDTDLELNFKVAVP